MIYDSTSIEGVYVFSPQVYSDFRGQNYETFNLDSKELINKLTGVDINFVSDSVSCSRKNTIRGLHGDQVTYKLITCLYGDIWFNVLDVREHSKTAGKTFSIPLGPTNMKQILLPPGVVNGHLCLSDTCVFSYKLSHPYVPQDAQITKHYTSGGLYWPIDRANAILSKRDAQALTTNLW